MIARDIIVSFCIFSLLKYHRIFVKNFELDIGKLKSLTQQFVGEGGGSVFHALSLKFMLAFM